MASPPPEPKYTILIRLPFPRGDFVDPLPVNWDSSKDEALWNIVSEVAKTEINWNEIAARFQVSVDFLLQQVQILTDRHTSQVKAQIRKAAATAKGSAAPSPVPGSEGYLANEAMQRTGSAAGKARAPSSLSIRKDSPLPRGGDGSLPGTPLRSTPRPLPARNSSSDKQVLTTRNLGGSSKTAQRAVAETHRRRISSLPITTSAVEPEPEPEPEPGPEQEPEQEPDAYPTSPGPADTSSGGEESSSESSPAQSRIIRRPPRFQSNDVSASFADDDEEDEPAFLARPQNEGLAGGPHDLSATLRGNPRDLPRRLPGKHSRIHQSQTSDESSASSAAPGPVNKGKGPAGDKGKSSGIMSPRARELSGRSPGFKGKGHSRDSDGTPSMGSSFSDLDDASVTQSALEEALASKLQDGGTVGLGSRMSTFGNAIRSRYLPNNNKNS